MEHGKDITAILPVATSADGKRNAHCFDCYIVEARMHYAVCLKRVAEATDSKLPRSLSDCARAISRQDCPAFLMKKEETAKGHAIYFVDRNAVGVVSAIVEKAKSVIARILPARSASVIDAIDASGYAKAINFAIEQQHSTKPKEIVRTANAALVSKSTQQSAVAGETPLQIARRLAGRI